MIYKFMLDQDNVRFTGQRRSPWNGVESICHGRIWRLFQNRYNKRRGLANDEQTSKNNVYILNEALEITGKLENLAPG